MQFFLFILGAVALVAGVATIGYGIPINQFSFGNTLIVVGTMSAIGGLIVIALGAVASQLQRLGDVVATRLPQRLGRSEAAEHVIEKPAPVPFTPKPVPAPAIQEPPPVETPAAAPVAPPRDAPPAAAEAPVLRNPDVSPAVEDISLRSVQEVSPPAGAGKAEPAREGRRPRFGFMRSAARPEPVEKPSFDRRPPPPPVSPRAEEPAARPSDERHFEAVWPPESTRPEAQPQHAAPAGDLPPEDIPPKASPTEPAAAPAEERPQVAILKSGVVDGMGYTLYVDGSIEAELPQGTLRFASINDLRAHLEKSA
ncbi:MAG TPA: hypothetical protein VFT69_15410 [Pseudolabrys sp.]|nr:hypothetical protein [Pseudolabrys sp.]